MENGIKICSVCGKVINDGDPHLTGGENCFICADCVAEIGQIYAKSAGLIPNGLKPIPDEKIQEETKETFENAKIPTPRELKEHLDKYVIGQDAAKERICVAVYNHYKRLLQEKTDDEVEIFKSNLLLTGPSGTGKTEMARCIAKKLDVPFAICDATSLTESGYVGDDVESILSKLLMVADYDVEKTQKGIIFIDEIDKIARKGSGPSITRDVSGEGVQQALLKIIEGSVVGVPPKGGRKHPEQSLTYIDTTNILFICAGAFEGLEDMLLRKAKVRPIGYSNEPIQEDDSNEYILSKVTAQDLRQYGMIPELLGRIPVITYTNPLKAEDLKQILTEPKNALTKQYIKLMEMDGIKLKFNDDALDEIVNHAVEIGLGARGLRSTMEDIMYKIMFNAPESKKKSLTVTKKLVLEQLNKK